MVEEAPPIETMLAQAPKINAERLKCEADERFDDLIGERRKTVRTLLEEAFSDKIKKLCEDAAGRPIVEGDPPVPVPSVPIRFRATTVASPAHDVFGEAVNNVFQRMLSRGAPPEFAHWFAYWYAFELDCELGNLWSNQVFSPAVYSTDGTIEASKMFIEKIFEFAQKVLLRTKNDEPKLREKWSGIYVSADQLKGRRSKQEDRFVAYPSGQYVDHSMDPPALLGVFDGHGGAECSNYAAAHLWEEWSRARLTFDGYLKESLSSAIANLDARMTKRIEVEHWKGGTTAVCCAIDVEEKKMVFAWLGDSAGYVLNNIEVRRITRAHSPDDPDEAKRVEAAGGQIFSICGENRVNGVLNLTRALGDVNGRPMILNEPEVQELDIEDNDYLVILACDGISEVFDTRQLYDIVEAFVKENNVEEYGDLADHICREALDAGSQDNLTCVIGFLKDPNELWELMRANSDSDTDGRGTDVEQDSYESEEA
ncbi:unnamed protein product [Caenorhabditis bovis]|uniref:PPM-type phosphatase domain-containing protein n=1 Tax=Caenorhabditis bovis TaxID=2654633 RepID=A0A8S1EL82_9PELO|nr:unnamed protein product [Caenorhabditis bovis]